MHGSVGHDDIGSALSSLHHDVWASEGSRHGKNTGASDFLRPTRVAAMEVVPFVMRIARVVVGGEGEGDEPEVETLAAAVAAAAAEEEEEDEVAVEEGDRMSGVVMSECVEEAIPDEVVVAGDGDCDADGDRHRGEMRVGEVRQRRLDARKIQVEPVWILPRHWS